MFGTGERNSMADSPEIIGVADGFFERFASTLRVPAPDEKVLERIGQGLGDLARTVPDLTACYSLAAPGEERIYRVAALFEGGPTLYVVSDGAGVSSPPHEHRGWSVTYAVSGTELNTLYKRGDSSSRTVEVDQERTVSAGQVLALNADAVHSTDVVGSDSIVHLHLYEKALSTLPSFEQRRFEIRCP